MALDVSPWLVLAVVPLVLTMATAFTKASVVLGALRVGLGAQVLLPWSAMTALALVVTAVVMGPVAWQTADAVQQAGGLDALTAAGASARAWEPVAQPLLGFVEQHAAVDELNFFAGLQDVGAQDARAIVPAFLVTELQEALQMAVMVLLPLVVVDLVVAQALTLLGLTNAPGPLVTLPLKVLLFLAVGGWNVVIEGLVQGYA